jgi:hypothetical protein
MGFFNCYSLLTVTVYFLCSVTDDFFANVSNKPTSQHMGQPRNNTKAPRTNGIARKGCVVRKKIAKEMSAKAPAPLAKCTPIDRLQNI